MNQDTNNKEYTEIDLAEIPKKFGGFLSMIYNKWNDFLFFLIKKSKIIIPLIILGFALGIYVDSKPASYKHEVIVYPNFESIDYLYSKIELINAKIKLRDTLFLEKLGIDKKLKLSKIHVIPISDPFLFVTENREYLELIKLLIDGSDMDKLLASEIMTKKFKSHKIEFITGEKIKDNNRVIENVIDFLNDNEYFEARRQQEVTNIQRSIQEYDTMNVQANDVLKSINNRNNSPSKNENISINNEYISYNEVLKVKSEIIKDKNEIALDLVLYDKTIKDIQTSKNLVAEKYLKGMSKFILPIFLILFYVFIIRFLAVIKKYRALNIK